MNRKRGNKIIFILTLSFITFTLFTHQWSPLYAWKTYKTNDTYQKTRIYCIILTSIQYLETRAIAVNQTWAPRCDGYSFICEYTNDTKGLPIAPIANITPGYRHLTQKTRLALQYAYENLLNDYEWFIKTDDDTYLIVENLKLFLKDKNPFEPISYGYNFKGVKIGGLHGGGAGYVLSRESVIRFNEAHRDPNTTCAKDGRGEDFETASCLRAVNVTFGISIDKYKRERFHHISFINEFRGRYPSYYTKYSQNKPRPGPDCCSDSTISFHYVSPDEQYLIDKMRYGFHGHE